MRKKVKNKSTAVRDVKCTFHTHAYTHTHTHNTHLIPFISSFYIIMSVSQISTTSFTSFFCLTFPCSIVPLVQSFHVDLHCTSTYCKRKNVFFLDLDTHVRVYIQKNCHCYKCLSKFTFEFYFIYIFLYYHKKKWNENGSLSR